MSVQQTRIADCAELLPGYALKARVENEPGGTHQVIVGRHLADDLSYKYIPKHELCITPRGKLDKYLVSRGDVLFVSRGTKNRAVVIDDVPPLTVASAVFYILRPKEGVEPAYLAWCLNQSPIMARIDQMRTGAGTPIVQRSEFGDIVVPLPSLEKQKQLATLGDLMAKEQTLRKKLTEESEKLHKAIGQKIMQQLITGKE